MNEMEERIFIRRDTGAEATFMKGLNDTVYKGNRLIELFNGTQPFLKIATGEELGSLLFDPIGYYDSILLGNIEHDKKLSVNMVHLANLYNISRGEFLTGLGIPQSQAERCYSSGGKEAKGSILRSAILTFEEYRNYSSFIEFTQGRLSIKQEAVEQVKDRFDVYAETEPQRQLYLHYRDLAETLNKAIEYHKVSQTNIKELAEMFNLLTLNNKLLINDIKIAEQIKYV